MNIFNYHNQIMEDYTGGASSFISIAQPRMRDFLNRRSLWPDRPLELSGWGKDYLANLQMVAMLTI